MFSFSLAVGVLKNFAPLCANLCMTLRLKYIMTKFNIKKIKTSLPYRLVEENTGENAGIYRKWRTFRLVN